MSKSAPLTIQKNPPSLSSNLGKATNIGRRTHAAHMINILKRLSFFLIKKSAAIIISTSPDMINIICSRVMIV